VSEKIVSDDEVLFRRIPPGKPWFEPPDRMTSANFKLRKNDLGLSVYRERFVSPGEVLNKPEAILDSMLAETTAGEVRALSNGEGKPLRLDVVAVGDENDAGHAEIRGQVAGKLSRSAAGALRGLFQLVPRPNINAERS
jgi:hypothetical protein